MRLALISQTKVDSANFFGSKDTNSGRPVFEAIFAKKMAESTTK
jgi:hypothetical protein